MIKARGFRYDEDSEAWVSKTQKYKLVISPEIFDSSKRLKNYKATEWNDNWVQLQEIKEEPITSDLPF